MTWKERAKHNKELEKTSCIRTPDSHTRSSYALHQEMLEHIQRIRDGRYHSEYFEPYRNIFDEETDDECKLYPSLFTVMLMVIGIFVSSLLIVKELHNNNMWMIVAVLLSLSITSIIAIWMNNL